MSGNVKPERVFELAQKWFGDIEKPAFNVPVLIQEPEQTQQRYLEMEKDVPLDAIFMAWPMQKRDSLEFIQADLLTDLLSFDRSSRFYQLINKEKSVFSDLDAHVAGTIDNGMLMVTGKLNPEYSVENGMEVINTELEKIKIEVRENEALKVKNKAVTSNRVGRLDHSNKAPALGFSAMLGDVNKINTAIDEYLKVTPADMQAVAQKILQPNKTNVLVYKAKNKLK